LIGFEFLDAEVEHFPESLISFLSLLEHKEILLFATCPIAVSEHRKTEIERKILSLLPLHCKFHTLYLCQGEVYDTILDQLVQTASEHPFDGSTKHLLEQYRMARGHPNREDIRRGYRVISAAFQLDTYYKAIYDTMKDLIVNLVGAVLLSVIGYFHVKHKGSGKIAAKFIPQIGDITEQSQTDN